MNTEEIPLYEVEHADSRRPDHWLNYDDNPDHHRLRTADEAIALASEYLRNGHLVCIRDGLLDTPVIQVNDIGVKSLSPNHPEEQRRMLTALWRIWWEVHDYHIHEITEDTGTLVRILESHPGCAIKLEAVEVLIGGNFILTLFELEDPHHPREVVRIEKPTSGLRLWIERTIAHELAYSLQCHDERDLQVNVVCKGVLPQPIESPIHP